MKKSIQSAKQEKGTIHFCVSKDQNDPALFHYFERFDSRAAFLAHANSAIDKEVRESGLMKDMTMTVVNPLIP